MFINKIVSNKIKEIKNKYKKNLLSIFKFLSYKNLKRKISIIDFSKPYVFFENKIFSPLKGNIKNSELLSFLKSSNSKYVKSFSFLNSEKFFKNRKINFFLIKRISNKKFLMKDFLIDFIQIYEGCLNKFDYILLIKYIINSEKIKNFIKLIKFLKIIPILEIHKIKELFNIKKIKKFFIIGFNNRNISNFKEDFIKLIKFSKLINLNNIVSESSIKNINYVFKYYNIGINYFLVGENSIKNNFFNCEKKL
ncbi:hypothetical protein ACWNYQ_00215 [Candidatus Vidania fulgoroideorum]